MSTTHLTGKFASCLSPKVQVCNRTEVLSIERSRFLRKHRLSAWQVYLDSSRTSFISLTSMLCVACVAAPAWSCLWRALDWATEAGATACTRCGVVRCGQSTA